MTDFIKVHCPVCHQESSTPRGEMDRRFARTAAVLALGEMILARVKLRGPERDDGDFVFLENTDPVYVTALAADAKASAEK